MLQPGRHANTSDYRYGFQGQEMDDEIKGEGNSLNYTFRMHDPRVGRFFAVDPLTMQYAHYSPYSFGGNKVIENKELEGLEEYHYTVEFDDNDEPILNLISVNDFVDVNSLTSFLHTLTFGLTDAPPVNPYERHIVHSGESINYFFDGGQYGAGFHEEEINIQYSSKADLISGLSTIKEDLASRKNLIEKSITIGQALSTVASEQQHYGTGARVKSNKSNTSRKINSQGNSLKNSLVPKVGGGAKLENLAQGYINRIQKVSNKYDLEITVVGSRAKGTADDYSDWDYIIKGGNSKTRSSALYALPKNPKAVKGGDTRKGSEELKGVEVDSNEPHITFTPEENPN
ncbi:RHS repeat-associated core domain-containing protein [Aequorivita antarctica]|uniref:Polymerase nucleotidyl transferase domain-containing protein n=1 Tax=Aequorivita antarctica TaxID=153266 RepID=A0A5C6YVD7_9FLAO|nr:RHS repeat-associated core domain-containing protein [Aequorivita antarctica]TXD71579.1 hypothetical protein ESU54_16280 [Aequorivita antarctica]SRX75277.1 hypothetical protein AEQU3_02271 [Aequorivita antarctica]